MICTLWHDSLHPPDCILFSVLSQCRELTLDTIITRYWARADAFFRVSGQTHIIWVIAVPGPALCCSPNWFFVLSGEHVIFEPWCPHVVAHAAVWDQCQYQAFVPSPLHTTGLRQHLVTGADIFISTKRTFQVKAGANLQIIVNPVTKSVTLAGTRSGLGLTKTLKTLALKCPWHLHTFRDRYFVTISALTRLVNNQNCYERNWTRSKQRQSIPFKICLVHPNIPPSPCCPHRHSDSRFGEKDRQTIAWGAVSSL